jgi:hypothetical protein
VILNRDDAPRPNPSLLPLRQLMKEFNNTLYALGLPRW